VRSHATDFLGRVLLYDVHFNFHAEHHEFPGIPSCRLPQLAARVAQRGAGQPTMWHSLATLVRAK
jgi:fatty acid desaturase